MEDRVFNLGIRIKESFPLQEEAALYIPSPALGLEVRDHVSDILSGVKKEVVCKPRDSRAH